MFCSISEEFPIMCAMDLQTAIKCRVFVAANPREHQ